MRNDEKDAAAWAEKMRTNPEIRKEVENFDKTTGAEMEAEEEARRTEQESSAGKKPDMSETEGVIEPSEGNV
ncbi:MAG: hypothetical protein QG633_333 [Patescibacteria group bacterium]|nr:hypothetical protein [Patescibacteria group bacterium]